MTPSSGEEGIKEDGAEEVAAFFQEVLRRTIYLLEKNSGYSEDKEKSATRYRAAGSRSGESATFDFNLDGLERPPSR